MSSACPQQMQEDVSSCQARSQATKMISNCSQPDCYLRLGGQMHFPSPDRSRAKAVNLLPGKTSGFFFRIYRLKLVADNFILTDVKHPLYA